MYPSTVRPNLKRVAIVQVSGYGSKFSMVVLEYLYWRIVGEGLFSRAAWITTLSPGYNENQFSVRTRVLYPVSRRVVWIYLQGLDTKTKIFSGLISRSRLEIARAPGSLPPMLPI